MQFQHLGVDVWVKALHATIRLKGAQNLDISCVVRLTGFILTYKQQTRRGG